MDDKNKEQKELKALKRKNRRQGAFVLLSALQIGSIMLAYYLGRSHK